MSGFLKNALRRVLFSANPEVCMDVACWARGKKLSVVMLYPSLVAEIEPHVKSDSMALEEFERHYEVLKRPQTLVLLENASVRDTMGVIELPDGRICYEGNWWLPYLQAQSAYRRRVFFRRRRLKGNCYSLLSLWGMEYYHWFHDVLPRLETALTHLPSDTRFLINESPRAYQIESLKAFGIHPKQLELQGPGVRTTVERLWFATPVGHSSLGSGEIICRVARRIMKYFLNGESNSCPRNIYISRRNASTRRVVNELNIVPLLQERGFDCNVLEDLTWIEQVRLFSNAKAIMGPHGAGLMNMMFARKNALIWEVSAMKRTVPCYVVLAGQLAHRFQRIAAGLIGNEANADMLFPAENIPYVRKCVATPLQRVQ